MIAVDTNILVRLLVRDDPVQTDAAGRLLATAVGDGDKVLVMLCALLETEWVLRSRYRFDRPTIAGAFLQLINTEGVTLEHEPTVEEALRTWELHPRTDFADCLLHARARQLGIERFMTFDKRAAQLPCATLLH